MHTSRSSQSHQGSSKHSVPARIGRISMAVAIGLSSMGVFNPALQQAAANTPLTPLVLALDNTRAAQAAPQAAAPASSATAGTPNTEIFIQVAADGTAPFDASDPLNNNLGGHTEGLDLNANNRVVRTFDAMTYRIHYNVNERDAQNVVISSTLPLSNVTWFQDADFPLPAGCLTAGVTPASSISADGKTLVCNLGPLREGSAGFISAVASVGAQFDNQVITLTATIDTDQSTPIASNAVTTTISAVPRWTWIKEAPDTYIVTRTGGVTGTLWIWPMYAKPGGVQRGSEPLNNSVPITFFDLAWDFVPISQGFEVIRNAAGAAPFGASWPAGRAQGCSGYDGSLAIPYGRASAAGANSTNTASGSALITCTATSNGYVTRVDITGQQADKVPTATAKGTANAAGIVIAMQIPMFTPFAAEVAKRGTNPSENMKNSIGSNFFNLPDPPMPGGYAATATPTQAIPGFNISPIFVPGANGPVAEVILPDNTANAAYGQISGSAGIDDHDWVRFQPGPLRRLQLSDANTGNRLVYSYDTLNNATRTPVANTFFNERSPWYGNGEVPRSGDLYIVTKRMVVNSVDGGASSSALHQCVWTEPTYYDLVPFDTSIPVFQVDPTTLNTTGELPPATPRFPWADVVIGTHRNLLGASTNLFDIDSFPTPRFALEFGKRSRDLSVELKPGGFISHTTVTCNDNDADVIGWTSTPTVTVDPARGQIYDYNMVRLRMLEPMPARIGPASVANLGPAYSIVLKAKVKPNKTGAPSPSGSVAPNGAKLYVHDAGAVGPWPVGQNAPGIAADASQSVKCGPVPGGRVQWRSCQYNVLNESTIPNSSPPAGAFDNNGYYYKISPDPNVYLAPHDKVSIGNARPYLVKTNLAGAYDQVDNGFTATFRIDFGITGSPFDVISNTRLIDFGDSTAASNRLEIVSVQGPFILSAGGVGNAGQAPLTPTVGSGTCAIRNVAPFPGDDGLFGSCNYGDRAGGFRGVMTVTVLVRGAEAGQAIANQAQMITRKPDNSGDDTLTALAYVYMPRPNAEMQVRAGVVPQLGVCKHDAGSTFDAFDGNPNPKATGIEGESWASRCTEFRSGNTVTWTLAITNTGNQSLTNLSLIDVLPWNNDSLEAQTVFSGTPASVGDVGDGRQPFTRYTGSIGIASITVTGTRGATGVVSYTAQSPALIDRNPATNNSTWTNNAAGATGFRVRVPVLQVAERMTVTFVMTTAQNWDNNSLYTNNFGDPTSEILLPARSNDVSASPEPPPLSIGNRVWFDRNNDGTASAGEAGMNGVTVTLQVFSPTLNAYVDFATTATDASGNYTFPNLISATYRVVIGPENFLPGGALTGYQASDTVATDPNNNVDNDSNGLVSGTLGTPGGLVASGPYTLAYEQAPGTTTLDFGFWAPAVFAIRKVVTTTDGSATPVISGTFTFDVNCLGATGFPTVTTLAAGQVVSYSLLPTATSCSASERVTALPPAPAGYTWLLASNATATLTTTTASVVTMTNRLAPQPVGANVLTVTKQVNWNGNVPQPAQPFTVTVNGPNGYLTTTTIISGGQVVITGLLPGIYTVTEDAVGVGWVTTYTVNTSAVTTPVTSTTQSVFTLTNGITATAAPTGPISGTVYNDYNSDGNITRNGVITETGLVSVTVTAYDRNGVAVGNTTTNLSGTYTLTPTAPGPWRLEFTNLPAGYYPSRVFTGTQNGTSVQFVSSAPASNVNFGVLQPCDYCQQNPRLVTINNLGSANVTTTNNSGVVSQLYDSATGTNAFRLDANNTRVGAAWGIGLQRNLKRMYVSALAKRFSGFGPRGPGGVYVLDYNNPSSASLVYSFTLQGVTPSNGGAPIDLGTITRTVVPGNIAAGAAGDFQLTDINTVQRDLDAFAKIGKVSYGEAEVDDSGNYLWLVNLQQRTLLQLDVTGPANQVPRSVNQYPIAGASGVPACTGGEIRPWALKFYQGKGYLGVVCDASVSQNRNDLRAYVLSFNPLNAAGGFSLEVTVPLTYTREAAERQEMSPGDPGNNQGAIRKDASWKPWADTWAQTGFTTTLGFQRFSYAQPMLSGIEFLPDGSMALGFANRFAEQSGRGYLPISGNTNEYAINNAGDTLKVCNVNGNWVLESSAGCPVPATTLSTAARFPDLSGDGLNGNGITTTTTNEFFWGDIYQDPNDPNPVLWRVFHLENSNGALATQPGRNELASSAYDPIWGGNFLFSQGINYFNLTTGGKADGWLVSQYDSSLSVDYKSMFKGNGMGDIELLCDPAPIEIGNRVWQDTNGNGAQDPGEPAFTGVIVNLQTPTGTLTTTTNASGQYLFQVQPNTAYTVTINPSQAALSGWRLTQADAQAISGSPASDDPISDTRDSDALLIGGLATILYTTGDVGQSNHGLDFGWVRPVTANSTITNTPPPPLTLGNYVWFDRNNDGVASSNETGFAGVTVTLQVFSPTLGAYVDLLTTTTTANGFYTFTNLFSATFRVVIGPENFLPGGALAGYRTSDTASADPNDGVDNDNNGLVSGTLGTPAGLVQSGPINLSLDQAPVNFGIDFGFWAPAVFMISKVVTTTDGSATPAFSGTFTFDVNCLGATGFPTVTTLGAGQVVSYSVLPVATSCTAVERVAALPPAPAGYTWLPASNATVAVSATGTSAVTMTNRLAPQPAGTNVLTVTKQVNWNGNVPQPSQPFTVTVNGPNGYLTTTTVISGGQLVITGLLPGIYTVTEDAVGAGWLTTYTVNTSAVTTPVTSTTQSVFTLTNGITATAAPTGPISGLVFNDYNSDGNRTNTSSYVEGGVGGVIVTAYDRNNNAVGSATTNVSGTYTLTPTAAGPWRLEFTNLPAGYNPSRVFTGTQNGTSVQFVSSAPASNVNLGVLEPCDYCQNNPRLTTVYMRASTNASITVLPAGVVSQLYDSATGLTAERADATNMQVGSAWGIGWQRALKRLYTSAIAKRHSGFGPQGPGGVYVLDYNNPSAASLVYSFTLQGVTPSNGGAPIDLGTITRTNVPGSISPGPAGDYQLSDFSTATNGTRDLDAFAKVGKTSYGDIEIDDSGNYLWMVNLRQRTLLQLDVTGPANQVPRSVNQYPIAGASGVPTCVDGELRPWALKFHRGKGYLGVVCDASRSTLETMPSGGPKSSNNLRAFVLSFNPENAAAGFSIETTVPLTYEREATYYAGMSPGAGSPPYEIDARWKPWTDDWNVIASNLGLGTSWSGIRFFNYGQPILSDIEFLPDGSMALGFANRFAEQSMTGFVPLSGNANEYTVYNGGDILKVCNVNGTWVLESFAGCPINTVTSFPDQKVDGFNRTGEFFWGDLVGGTYNHLEIANGALAFQPGRTEIASTAMDPVYDRYRAQGVTFISTVGGGKTDGWEIDIGNITDRSRALKGNGLGDIELLCDPAPLEIGNRVWQDSNQNGVQDAGEPAFSGVIVNLQTPTGTLTTTTNASGQYLFQVQPNTAYTVTINPNQPALSGWRLTQADAQAISGSPASNDPISDTRDSDAVLIGGLATILYTTGDMGQSNHGLDFGWVRAVTANSVITNTAPPGPVQFGDRVWLESDGDGIASTGTITPIAGMIITATSSSGQVFTATTDAQGYYSFTVDAGTYTVTYGTVPALYGAVLPSATPFSSTASGNSGSYAQAGNPDQGRPQNSTVTLTPGQANWTVDFAFFTVRPAIAVVKYTNGYDADAVTGPFLTPGDVVTWTYVVRNTGNVSITVAANQLVDDKAGTVNTSTLTLAVGQAVTLTKTGVAIAGQYTNTAIVTGTHPNFPTAVTATNPSSYFGVAPALDLKKYTNGYDADALPLLCGGTPAANNQPCINAGETVTWTYVVSNTGNVPITIAAGGLNDDKAGPINASAVVLQVGETRTFTQTGTAIGGQYTNTGTITGTPALTASVPVTPDLAGFASNRPPTTTITDTDPSHYFGYAPAIALTKYTVGFDADAPTGPYLQQGGTVTWTYLITNTGNVTLTNLTLVDDKEGPIVCPVTELAAGASTLCTQTGTVSTVGQYSNTATVTGTNPFNPGAPVTATNPSHYFGAQPQIKVVKFTNGFDADTVTDTMPQLKNGAGVTWRYVVTNTGNVTQNPITLFDDRVGTISCPQAFLAPGESVVCVALGTADAAQGVNDIYTNTAIVTGTPVTPAGNPVTLTLVTDTNPSHYRVITPTVSVIKYTNGYDANGIDDVMALLKPGDPVTWTYIVRNNGNVPLTVTLTDDRVSLAGATCTPFANGAVMQPGDVTTCTLSSTADVAQTTGNVYSNTADVAGDYEVNGNIETVTDTDPSHYRIYTPSLQLKKYTNGYDADTLADPRVVLLSGMPVTWTYVVTNNGTVPMTWTLTDDREALAGAVCTPKPIGSLLQPGEVVTCTLSSTADEAQTVNGIYSNTATVTGTVPAQPAPTLPGFPAPQPEQITKNDPSHYEVVTPAIALTKYTNGEDADTVTGPQVQAFGPVTWTYLVTNTGNVTLTIAANQLVDDKEGQINGSAFSLAPGESTWLTKTGIAQVGQYTNTGVVTGTPSLTQGTPDLPGFPAPVLTQPVTATNPSHYIGLVSSLGNYVWEDLNRDGIQDPNEPAIAGVTVTLQTPTGTLTTVTDANGFYSFTNLLSGVPYTVSFTAPAGYTFTLQNTTNITDDSNVDPFTGVAQPVVLGLGENNPTIDAGLWQPMSLGNRVWQDFNNDGADANEPGVAGVTMTLYLNGSPVATTTTDANGYYTFTGLVSGTYSVTAQLPAGYISSSPDETDPNSNGDLNDNGIGSSGGLVSTGPIVMIPGTEPTNDGDSNPNTNFTIDFGIWQPMSLGNRVFEDQNNDGIDALANGIAGVTMTLYLNGVAISTTVTDANGYYLFTGLVSGTYSVTAELPAGYVSSTPDETDPNADGDFNDNGLGSGGGIVSSGPIVMIPNTEPTNDGDNDNNTNLTIDFGAWLPASLGNFVWEDYNHDGVQDPNEPGIAGVQVTLYLNGVAISTTTTDANGNYAFNNLLSGVPYTLSFNAPANYTFTLPGDGSNPAGDSNVNPLTGVTPAVILQPGENNPTIDAGLWRPMSLGNRVWEDLNNDGIDASEPAIAGVTMTLYLNGVAISETTTDANGYYTFTGLVSGTYSVTAQLPAGYISSSPDETDPNADGDLNDNGVGSSGGIVSTGPITMIPGTEPADDGDTDANTNFTIDFGAWRPASLGNFVWEDLNHDGIQDANEPGIAGVTVTLQSPSGVITTVTDANGFYSFTNLLSGVAYALFFDKPAGYDFTLQNTTNITDDSDVDPLSGVAPSVILGPGENNLTIDAGLWRPASLGNFVWEDLNRDGIQDANEPGIAGVTVTLQTPTGTLTTVTDANGFYSFTNLISGVPYTVSFSAPAGYTFTLQNTGTITDDSNVDPFSGVAQPVTLQPGENNPTIDAGLWRPMSLGNRVWEDLNNDGVDASEPALAGVTMTLYLNGVAISTTTTDAGGYYTFTGLLSGTYSVTAQLPAGYVSSTPDETDPNSNGDLNDNGVGSSGGIVSSGPIVMIPGTESTTDGDADANTNFTIDFGAWKPASLGNFVWEDYNHDGVQDANEPGIAGVIVTLQTPNGPVQTQTDANGFYSFTNLISGVPYTVSFTAPAGYAFTLQNTTNITDDSDVDPLTGVAPAVILAPGENNPTIDAGLWRPMSLGNRVWQDFDNNGLDTLEDGVAGVTMTLYLNGVAISTTTTDANGFYRFTGLVSGTYSVTAQLPAGYVSSTPDETDPNADVDNNDNGLGSSGGIVSTGPIVMIPGTEPTDDGDSNSNTNWSIDFGIWQPMSLGNRVWNDVNNDGQDNNGEAGVSGVTMTLYLNGVAISTTVTDAGGYYTFTNLISGIYTVTAELPAGYVSSTPDEADPNSDGDLNDNGLGLSGGIVTSGPINMSPGTEPNSAGDGINNANFTIDFGIWRPASLGDFVWEDLNHDGIQDANEPGIAGVTVTLQTPTGTLVTTTDANGLYTFTNLTPGVPYTVSFEAPAGYTFTLQGDGSNPAGDSNANPFTGVAQPVILTQGENNPTIDAGLWRPMSLGNRVWEDVNNDGQDNNSESGVAGVTMMLYLNGVAISTTVTDAGGYYTFTNLVSGTYSVTAQLPAGYVSSTPDETDPNSNGDLNDNGIGLSGGIVTSGPIVMIPGTESTTDGDADANTNFTIDFGIWRPASLGNFVWEDLNHDGIQDANEPGIAGVVVTLQTPTGTIQTQTDANGYYSFTNLFGGVPYTVSFEAPAGYTFTLQNTGMITNDSNVDPFSGVAQPVTLQPGENNPTIDAGLWRPMSLGNRVWNDVNNDGQDNNGEAGVGGVTMMLYLNGVAISTTVTDAGGYYTFTNLVSGTYSVTAQLPAGYVSSTPDETDPNADGDLNDNGIGASGGVVTSGPIVMIPGTEPVTDGDTDANTNFTIDFGIWQPASLGDRVWNDANADGIQDQGESGVVGVTVVLYDALTNSPIATTTTGAGGTYSFTNLLPGSYFVEFVLPADYGRSPQGAGTDPAADSNADVTTGRTALVTLVAGENNPTIDAGIFQYSSLGDRVWFDSNHDGIQDAGEPGVAGVTVTLYLDGVPISTTVTDGTGFYGFNQLTPTVPYTVQFTLPNGFVFTYPKQGGDDATDSDVDASGATGPVSVPANSRNPNVDAGLWAPMSLGNQVWFDLNNNGTIDAGEAPVSGVTMELYRDTNGNGVWDAGDALISTTVTDGGGFYLFSGLIGGPYLVVVPASNFAAGAPLAGYRSSTFNDTTDGNVDNVDDGRPAVGGAVSSGVITMTFGSEPSGALRDTNLTVDFGFWLPASLGDRVWLDVDRNGQQDAGEAGVAGVTVTLYDGSGAVIATTTTDANGNYSFTQLIPGTYSVGFTLPNGYGWTLRDVGSDGGDSDADPATGRTGSYTLAPGENNPTVDGGLWRAPALVIEKAGLKQGTVGVGDVLTYVITIRNPGGTAALNVVLSDPLPAYLTYLSASSEPAVNATHNAGNNTVTWPVGTLMPGSTFAGMVVVQLNSRPNSGLVQNVAGATSDGVTQTLQIASNEVQNPLQPTAVTLARFEANVLNGGGVQVVWETSLERDSFGFYVLRSVTGNRADAVRVNAEMMAAKGGNSLTRYSVDDPAGGVNNTYWLEEVELSGATREYGPVKASASVIAPNPNSQPVVPQPSAPNAGVGVIGGGVPVAQPAVQQPVAQPAVQSQVQQPVVQLPAQPAVQPQVPQPAAQPAQAPAAQPAQPVLQPEAQPAVQPTAQAVVQPVQPAADQQPVVQPQVQAQPAQPAAQPEQVSEQATEQVVVGAETGVNVARGGQPAMPKLPNATMTAEGVEAAASQPLNPLLPVGAGVLALLGLAAGAVALHKRSRRKS